MSVKPDKNLYPLVVEEEHLQIEKEIKESFISVYNKMIGQRMLNLLAFGMPYLINDKETLNWFLLHEGLSLPTNEVNIENLKYLMKAWEGERHKRGTDFLETILQCLYPNEYKLDQMWQDKTQPYPTALATKTEAEKSSNDHFLTSRISVEVTDMAETGEYLIAYQNALQKMVSAKFVLEMTLLRSFGGKKQALAIGSCFNVDTATKIDTNFKTVNFDYDAVDGRMFVASSFDVAESIKYNINLKTVSFDYGAKHNFKMGSVGKTDSVLDCYVELQKY